MTSLIKYDAACRALAECKAIDEVKTWADKAAAMQAYGRMAKDKTLEVDAAEIRIRAERRLGQLIAAQKEFEGLNRGRAGRAPIAVDSNDRDSRPKLSDAGISKDLSSKAQKLAAVPEEEFEAEVGQWRDRVQAEGARVSTRLQSAGERELKRQEEEEGAPDQAEFDSVAAAQKAEEMAMRLLLASDEPLADVTANYKQALLQIERLNARIVGLQNQSLHQIKTIKGLQAKLKKMEAA
jgi:hypothetical protein